MALFLFSPQCSVYANYILLGICGGKMVFVNVILGCGNFSTSYTYSKGIEIHFQSGGIESNCSLMS